MGQLVEKNSINFCPGVYLPNFIDNSITEVLDKINTYLYDGLSCFIKRTKPNSYRISSVLPRIVIFTVIALEYILYLYQSFSLRCVLYFTITLYKYCFFNLILSTRHLFFHVSYSVSVIFSFIVLLVVLVILLSLSLSLSFSLSLTLSPKLFC